MSQTVSPSPIAASVEPFITSGKLAGATLLVASRSGILAHEAVGFSDLSRNEPMQRDTVFWIASITKPLTATALMILVDEGLINLDDRVEQHIPEFKGQRLSTTPDAVSSQNPLPGHPITIREILSHTSGLPFRSPVEWPKLDQLSLKIATESYSKENLLFEPGSKYGYSNEGTNTAGRIIEVVAGLPYAEFLKKRLLDPLKMTETVFVPNHDQVRRLAKCYRLNSTQPGLQETPIEFLSYPLSDPARQPIPGGGLFSTATDLARFCRMILHGGELDGTRYLSERSIQEMTRKQTGRHVADSYGLGWAIEGTSFGHGGAHGSHFWINSENDLITIYLVAYDGKDSAVKESHDLFVAAAKNTFK